MVTPKIKLQTLEFNRGRHPYNNIMLVGGRRGSNNVDQENNGWRKREKRRQGGRRPTKHITWGGRKG